MPALIRILHLSDTHALSGDALHYGRVDTAAQLARVLNAIDPRERFDLVVVSGDVSEDGTEESYRRVRASVDHFAAQRGARSVYAMGNHDQRRAFRAVLGAGQPGAREAVPDGAEDRPVVSVASHGGLRLIVLDSSIPGAGYGRLDGTDLDWLAAELSTPAERGTVIVVHHPPIAARTELLDALALQDPDDLLDVVSGTDVRVVLSGHYHLPLVQFVRGVPIVVAPGVANIARAVADAGEESATGDAGAAIVELGDDLLRVVPFVVPAVQDEVFHYDAAQVRAIIAAAGPSSDR